MKFKVGDRVIVIENMGPGYPSGKGTVVEVEGHLISVNYDDYFGGHNCTGLCKRGHGWVLDEEQLKHYILNWKQRLGGRL